MPGTAEGLQGVAEGLQGGVGAQGGEQADADAAAKLVEEAEGPSKIGQSKVAADAAADAVAAGGVRPAAAPLDEASARKQAAPGWGWG